MRTLAALVAAVACLAAPSAIARTKLAALPQREATVIRLDNPRATLVEEERVVPLQEGDNLVDFSWRGVRVDPDSIRLALLTHPEDVALLSVSYPPGEDALLWRIHSKGSWEERVRISYLLSDIDRLVEYKGVTGVGEGVLDLQGHLVLRNFSGEDFELAEVDLGRGETLTRSVSHEETRKARLFRAREVPIRKTFTWDAAVQPWEPARVEQAVGIPVHYVLRNEEGSGLGRGALWGGKVRVYQEDGHGGTIFLGEDRIPSTPEGAEARIYIGDSRDVSVTQHKTQEDRINPRPSRYRVRLYDTEEVVVAEVKNFKNRAVAVDLVEHIPGEWEMVEASQSFEKRDATTLVFRVEVPASGVREVRYHYHRRNVRP